MADHLERLGLKNVTLMRAYNSLKVVPERIIYEQNPAKTLMTGSAQRCGEPQDIA